MSVRVTVGCRSGCSVKPQPNFTPSMRVSQPWACKTIKDTTMTEIEDARSAKRLKGTEYSIRFYDRYAHDVRNWKLERPDQAFLDLITTGHLVGRALWCNRNVRAAAQHALIDALLEQYQAAPDRPRYWVTIAWDLGVTLEREPELDLVAIRNIAQHRLRRAGLDGFGIVEVDVWKNLTGERGRRMVAHIHFFGWSTNPEPFRRLAVQKSLCAKRGLRNSLGARSVVVKRVGQGAPDVAHLGMYMTKAPSAAKNLLPGKHSPKLRSATLAQGSAARLLEVLSHVEVGDVMFAIGEGKTISRAVQQAIRFAIEPGRGKTEAPTHTVLVRHWRRIRLLNGSRRFREPIIVTRANQRDKS